MTDITLEQRAALDSLREALPPPPKPGVHETIAIGSTQLLTIHAALVELEAALRLSAGAGVDWRAQYRLQTAMRYMDNAPRLTLNEAYKMADHDVRGLELAAAHRHETGEVQGNG